jgi:hypothetical protein
MYFLTYAIGLKESVTVIYLKIPPMHFYLGRWSPKIIEI